MQPNTFADHAHSLSRAGLAVIPSRGKAAIAKGFPKWRRALDGQSLDRMAAKNPDAGIAYIPGLSLSGRGLVIIDADDAQAVEQVRETFGDTPGRVQTRRGKHFLYAANGESLGKISSLKKHGINADVKHGQAGSGIVIAPPSAHATDATFCYSWDGCDLSVLPDLPPFDAAALRTLVETRGSKTLPNASCTAPLPAPMRLGTGHFRDGSRKLGLNDHLAGVAWSFDSIDGALDAARTWNNRLGDSGLEPMADEEVMSVVTSVMKDLEAGKLERRLRQRAACTSDADEIRWLSAMDGGDGAFMLLQLLRAEHAGRTARGKTFVLNVRGMVTARTLGSWGARKYRGARDLLLQTGLLIETSPAGYRRAAEYRLAPRLLTPSVAIAGGHA